MFRKLHPNLICHEISTHHHFHLIFPSALPLIYLGPYWVIDPYFIRCSIMCYHLYLFWCSKLSLFGNWGLLQDGSCILYYLFEHFLTFRHIKTFHIYFFNLTIMFTSFYYFLLYFFPLSFSPHITLYTMFILNLPSPRPRNQSFLQGALVCVRKEAF